MFTFKDKKKIIDNIIDKTISDHGKPNIKWEIKQIDTKCEEYYTIIKVTKNKFIYLLLTKRQVISGYNIYLDFFYTKNISNRNKIRLKINNKMIDNVFTLFLSNYKELFLLYGYIKYDNIQYFNKNFLDDLIYEKTINKDILWEKSNDNYISYDMCLYGNCITIILTKNSYYIRTTSIPSESLSWIKTTPSKLYNIIKEYYD